MKNIKGIENAWDNNKEALSPDRSAVKYMLFMTHILI